MVEDGTPAAIFGTPEHERTRTFPRSVIDET
jgi:hypothetical protein